MFGIGRLLEMKDQKWDEDTEKLRMTLELDKWGKSTKKGMSQVLYKVLLLINPVCTRRKFVNQLKCIDL
jgi:hypothetical protein